MTHPDGTILNVGDDQVISAINSATTRLVIVAPGLSCRVAEAVALCWSRLGAKVVKVVLDVDPAVCRLGYGEADALRLLQTAAAELGTEICHQRAVRICLVVSDESILVFSPTPLVVEAKSPVASHPNGLKLDFVPRSLESDLGFGDRGKQDQTIGLNSVSSEKVDEVLVDLSENPPRKFDLAQQVQVFNAAFEFVEFSVEGCSISRKTVRIPSDLVGLGRDPKTQNKLRSTFKLIDDDNDRLSGEKVMKLKDLISKKYLENLPNYGNVVLRLNKVNFERAVTGLRRYVGCFHRTVEVELQAAIDESRKALVEALAPGVANNPPSRSTSQLGPKPDREAVKRWLDITLRRVFGNASDYLTQMDVKLIFKGVTYELLSDPKFVKVAREKLPTLKQLHEEFDTAKAVSEKPEEKEPTLWDGIDQSSEGIN